ncbi:MAG: hypothetical protein WCJ10_04555 [Opitutaceae bacterium]
MTPYLPIVHSEFDRINNLILHCVLVLSRDYDATAGYTSEKANRLTITPRTGSIGPDLENHYRSLEEIEYLLAPLVPEISPCAFSSSKQVDFICAFRRIALEARLKSSEFRLHKATSLMEKALAKFPFALASYILEVAPAIPSRPHLSRLARIAAKAMNKA